MKKNVKKLDQAGEIGWQAISSKASFCGAQSARSLFSHFCRGNFMRQRTQKNSMF